MMITQVNCTKMKAPALLAALALGLALPLGAQAAGEEVIELPDVTTAVSGDTLTAGKDSIPDYSSVLPGSESGKIQLPVMDQPVSKAAAPSQAGPAVQAPEKTVYAEGQIGGGFPFLFLGDFAIYRATGNAPFSLTFTHRSAEDFASHKAEDGFFARTTAVGAVQALQTDNTSHSFTASYDTADYGLQSLSAPFFDMVNHTIAASESSVFNLPYGWEISLGGSANWYNRYGGSKTGDSDLVLASNGGTVLAAAADAASHTVVFDLAPHFGFGWKNQRFAAGFTARYQLQGNLGDRDNFAKIDGSSYRNATHRGQFGVNTAFTSTYLTLRGTAGLVVGSALGKPALLAPFSLGADVRIPYDEVGDDLVLLSLEGGLDSYQQTLRELEKAYRFAYSAVLPTESSDWYGKARLSLPLFDHLSAHAGVEFRKTAFENGVWTADYSGSRDGASGLYLLAPDERTDCSSEVGASFDRGSFTVTASWKAYWLDLPALADRQNLLLSAAWEGSRCTLSARWRQALGADSEKAPDLGAGAALRLSSALRIALEANDIVKLLTNSTRSFAHSAYKAESGNAALLVKFQF